ncbi:hypothetical protein [Telluribacter sp. SYSU D00476]|uniref:hypothetical protein n=1 Tax=Telluribacter sp. SYSU D00476 TaxID=2811430 RepID=UPI001FF5B0B4|nr:hypothetical protein [Telluribacter sp. SYSU D00476]
MNKILMRCVAMLVVVLLTTADVWAQCAMCRGSVESTMGNGRNNVGVGLNTGIMYLFFIPYLAVAIIGYLWYRNSKKLRAERQLVASRIQQAYPKH